MSNKRPKSAAHDVDVKEPDWKRCDSEPALKLQNECAVDVTDDLLTDPERGFESQLLSETDKMAENCGLRAPPWRPKKSVTMCQIVGCNAKFKKLSKRHHCKCCSNIICSDCCAKAPLCYSNFESETVCGDCYFTLLKKYRKGFFDADLKEVGIVERSELRSRFKPPKNSSVARKNSNNKKTSVIRDDDGSVSGYLQRYDGKKKEWKEFWAKLPHGTCALELYRAPNDTIFKEKMVLHGYELNTNESEDWKLEIIHRNQYGPTNMVCTFRANSPQSAQKWAHALEEACKLK